MRLAVLFAFVALVVPVSAWAQAPTLDSIAADALVQRYPANPQVDELGWSRDRASTAPIEQDWTIMAETDMPTGQVVPW